MKKNARANSSRLPVIVIIAHSLRHLLPNKRLGFVLVSAQMVELKWPSLSLSSLQRIRSEYIFRSSSCCSTRSLLADVTGEDLPPIG